MPNDPAYHPVADRFPMMTDDELAEMAADIAERGLVHPIVRDAKGRILDGRNRYAACKIAKVEPVFEDYAGDDPDGYALSVNIQRRNLTKGQAAMIAAVVCKDSVQPVRKVAQTAGTSAMRISQANVVLQFLPGKVDAVIAGAVGLDAAYAEAVEQKRKDEGAEAQLARLRDEDPELADRVVEGDLSLPAAWVERKERLKHEERDRQAGRDAAARLVTALKTDVSSIAIAVRIGERSLISDGMIEAIRDAADLLDKLSRDGADER